MKAPFEELAGLDRLIHEPARLAVLTALGSCESADFLYLQRLTGLSKGNLSSHLSKLEEAGLVTVEKQFKGKTPLTRIAATDKGREAVEQHWRQLEQLRTQARSWAPEGKDEPEGTS
ncbi:MAG TPA: transcriptional regulator [Myxococcaceae bacterium]